MAKDYDDKGGRFAQPGKTPLDDIPAVMKFYKLPKAFPREVLEEADRSDSFLKDAGKRLDLRKKFIFTCDPVTARDYDDALSLEKDRRGRRVLGVHIADVSHFVRPGSALDREAYKRSTSVYFPGKVVPMLPEALSNGLCSLVPEEDRLAFSVFMTYDKSGKMVAASFAKSVIRSSARFTYEQVMSVINGAEPEIKGAKRRRIPLFAKPPSKTAAKTIRAINDLARQLRAARFAEGALDLEVPETEVVLDAEGEMTGIVSRPYDESHQMVEECMVAANEAVAKELWTNGIKILARFHGTPDPEKLLMLRSELGAIGVKCGNLENRKVFAQFLQTIKRNPLYPTIATMVLRSMKRAVYDASEMGHFGLAKRFYAHFTSPIRRYPDLTLHRQLAAYLENGKGRVPQKLLERWAAHTSEREEIATEAERSLLEIKKYRLLEAEIDSRTPVEYEAVVSKCTPFGCFVEIPSIATSGLIHISRLSHSFVRFNESDQTLSAGGRSWRIGDTMKVTVDKVDYSQRRIDFIPVGLSERNFSGRKGKEPKGHTPKTRKHTKRGRF